MRQGAVATTRIIHAMSYIILVAFTFVQYNDPDFYFWMPVYGVPAILIAIATRSPAALGRRPVQVCIAVCAVLGVNDTVLL